VYRRADNLAAYLYTLPVEAQVRYLEEEKKLLGILDVISDDKMSVKVARHGIWWKGLISTQWTHLDLDNKLYDKRDDFNFPIVNYPFLDSNSPSSPAYGVYMSQLIRYSRTSNSYQDFSTPICPVN